MLASHSNNLISDATLCCVHFICDNKLFLGLAAAAVGLELGPAAAAAVAVLGTNLGLSAAAAVGLKLGLSATAAVATSLGGSCCLDLAPNPTTCSVFT